MIFAELQYDQSYSDEHAQLVALLCRHFQSVESGLQGDSWVWIVDNDQKVSVDTFTSMRHEIKSSQPCRLLDQVLAVLAGQYTLQLMAPATFEGLE